jgi:hypothetical protein
MVLRFLPGLMMLVAATLLVPAPGLANHLVFDFSFERFEVDGNVHGPFDSTADFADEFNQAGPVPPNPANWSDAGTVFENLGVLHLANPGTTFPLAGSPDTSYVVSTVPIQDGAGDANLTLTWKGGPIPTNQAIWLLLLASGAEGVALRVSNMDAAGEALTGIPQGYQISQLPALGADHQHIAVQATDLVGEVSLRIFFDDATNSARASFKLPVSGSFTTPFVPTSLFQTATSASFFVLGAAYDPPVPTTTSSTTSTTSSTTTITSGTTTTTMVPALFSGSRMLLAAVLILPVLWRRRRGLGLCARVRQ